MKEILTEILNAIGWAYWVKIETKQPNCTYYFGPFANFQEAKLSKVGYVEDLNQEGATGITIEIKRCKPRELTIFNEREENLDFNPVPVFGTQS